MNDRKPLGEHTDPLHTYVHEDSFFALSAPDRSNAPKTLCLFLMDPKISEQAREGHFSLISGYTRENEPKCVIADALAVLLIDGGVEGAERLCGRILQLFSSLHLADMLTIVVTPLREALSPGHAEELVSQGRSLPSGAVHTVGT